MCLSDKKKLRNLSINQGEITGALEWGSGISCGRSPKVDLLHALAVAASLDFNFALI